jgi:hypothetical protein
MAADAVLYADCSVAAGADARVKGFANICYKDKEGIAEDIASKGITSEGVVLKGVVLEGVLCHKDKEGEQKREKVVASLVRVELRRLRRNTVIISLSLTSVFASLLFV